MSELVLVAFECTGQRISKWVGLVIREYLIQYGRSSLELFRSKANMAKKKRHIFENRSHCSREWEIVSVGQKRQDLSL